MQKFNVRTDLAAEAHALRLSDGTPVEGVSCEEFSLHGVPASRVRVENQKGADAIGKPVGTYLTLEMEKYVNRRENSFSDCASAVAELLAELEAIKGAERYLIACLGNRAVTPDALGPEVADKLIVTRHLKSVMPAEFAGFSSVSVLRTGVLGTTGIESADSLSAICGAVKPDCVIAVDALASGEFKRLCRSIQICDSGISPGSGVGNDRAALSRETLGIPVVAVGVPTVIDASAFSNDEAAKGLFVTPRNIDELVKSTAKLIAYGINLALHDGITIGDVDLLVE